MKRIWLAIGLVVSVLCSSSGAQEAGRWAVEMDAASAFDAPAVAEALGLRVVYRFQIIPFVIVEGTTSQMEVFLKTGLALSVEAERAEVEALEDTLPWGVDKIDAEVVWGGADKAVNVSPGQGGVGITVAILDTGIDCSHPDLAGADCLNGPNYVGGSSSFDDHGHGTHVSGIVAARDNGAGLIGTAPKVRLIAIKVLDASGSGSYFSVAQGIDYAAAQGYRVINMSLGGPTPSDVLEAAVKAAAAKGVAMVASAGNSGACSPPGCSTVGYPAKYVELLAVAATNSSDARAPFSSVGSEVDVSAPGVDVPSTVPKGGCALCDSSGYRALSGTSMASPHVAAAVALLLGKGMTVAQARSALETTAVDLGVPGRDNEYGFGRIDVRRAAGIVNPPPPDPDPQPPPPPVSGIHLTVTSDKLIYGTFDHITLTARLESCTSVSCTPIAGVFVSIGVTRWNSPVLMKREATGANGEWSLVTHTGVLRVKGPYLVQASTVYNGVWVVSPVEVFEYR